MAQHEYILNRHSEADVPGFIDLRTFQIPYDLSTRESLDDDAGLNTEGRRHTTLHHGVQAGPAPTYLGSDSIESGFSTAHFEPQYNPTAWHGQVASGAASWQPEEPNMQIGIAQGYSNNNSLHEVLPITHPVIPENFMFPTPPQSRVAPPPAPRILSDSRMHSRLKPASPGNIIPFNSNGVPGIRVMDALEGRSELDGAWVMDFSRWTYMVHCNFKILWPGCNDTRRITVRDGQPPVTVITRRELARRLSKRIKAFVGKYDGREASPGHEEWEISSRAVRLEDIWLLSLYRPTEGRYFIVELEVRQ